MFVALGTRFQQVVGVFDHEGIFPAGDEFHEDLVAFEAFGVAGVQRPGLPAALPRHRAEDRADQPGLAGTGRPLHDQHGFVRRQIAAHEVVDAPGDLRIGAVQQAVVGQFLDFRAFELALRGDEVPIDRKHRFVHARVGDQRRDPGQRRFGALHRVGPDREPARTVFGLRAAVGGHEQAFGVDQQFRRAQALRTPARLGGETVEQPEHVFARGETQRTVDRVARRAVADRIEDAALQHQVAEVPQIHAKSGGVVHKMNAAHWPGG